MMYCTVIVRARRKMIRDPNADQFNTGGRGAADGVRQALPIISESKWR
jgi:hypothetical protein